MRKWRDLEVYFLVPPPAWHPCLELETRNEDAHISVNIVARKYIYKIFIDPLTKYGAMSWGQEGNYCNTI